MWNYVLSHNRRISGFCPNKPIRPIKVDGQEKRESFYTLPLEATEAISTHLDSHFPVLGCILNSIMTSKRLLVPLGTEERWTAVDGHRMRYLFAGSGPPLLLIHGLMGFSFSWSENLAVLSEHFTVYAPDLLNTGYSERCELDPTLYSTASQILSFMDSLSLHSTDILGSSYGGTAAMMLAAIAPHQVNRLILVSPAHCGSEGTARWQSQLFSTTLGGYIAKLLYLAPAAVHGYFIKRMYAVPSRALPGTVQQYAAAIRIRGTIKPLVNLMCCWRKNFDSLAAVMPQIKGIPALLVWGDKDEVVPISTMPALAANFSNVITTVIPNTGHLPYEELPAEFNRAVLQFLLAPALQSSGQSTSH
ncbi:MAG: Alpha/beta hydrolase [Acidobacteriales bacterium]|nr:Alpha/beta hydrolase [Terriglobales bacterium]